jgi:MoaA/NifB/PqqE/SkfB family radical SAM enzyme
LSDIIPLDTPLAIEICISSICNLACKFCFQSDDEIRKKYGKLGIMSEELLYKLIDDIRSFPTRVKNIKFLGVGEELVNPKAAELISYTCKENVADMVELTTNGVLLNPRICDTLVACGLNRINFSIESLTNEGYERICGRYVDVQKIVDNVRYLHSNRRGKENPTIYVKIPDIEVQTDEQKRLFFETFGDICDEIFIEHIIPVWHDATSTDFIIDKVTNNSEMLTEFNTAATDKLVCPFPFYKLYISSNGLVRWCCDPDTINNPIGNVNNMSLVEIWNSMKLYDFQCLHLRGEKFRDPLCRKCKLIKFVAIDNIDGERIDILKRLTELRR